MQRAQLHCWQGGISLYLDTHTRAPVPGSRWQVRAGLHGEPGPGAAPSEGASTAHQPSNNPSNQSPRNSIFSVQLVLCPPRTALNEIDIYIYIYVFHSSDNFHITSCCIFCLNPDELRLPFSLCPLLTQRRYPRCCGTIFGRLAFYPTVYSSATVTCPFHHTQLRISYSLISLLEVKIWSCQAAFAAHGLYQGLILNHKTSSEDQL